MDVNSVLGFASNVIEGIFIPAIGGIMFLVNKVHKRFDEHEAKIERINENHNTLKEVVIEKYTLKNDFRDCMNRIDDKLDDLKRMLMERAK